MFHRFFRTPPHLGGHENVTHVDRGILDHLVRNYAVSTMVDIGCGPGGTVALAEEMGVRATGIDGDRSLRRFGHLRRSNFIVHDFARGPLAWDRPYDLAWSVEFLEHVEERFVDHYMPLFRHARVAFCTAAPPGTPGHHHVNCRPLAYWREVFDAAGFAYDEDATAVLRRVSTMEREFARLSGMFYVNTRR